MNWIDWGDAPAWVAAIVAIIAMIYSIVQARGAKHAVSLARAQAASAQTAAVAAERSAAAAEEQAKAQREQAEIMRQQFDRQHEEDSRPRISVEPGPHAALAVVPLVFTHSGGADLERVDVKIDGSAVRGFSRETATHIIGVPPTLALPAMSYRDQQTVWVDIGAGPANAANQVTVTLTAFESGEPPREWQLPRKTVQIPPYA